MRPRRQRLLLLRVAVVVRHKPVRLARLRRLAVSVAIAVAILRLVRVRPLSVERRSPGDAAAAPQRFVGSAHGAMVGVPADKLGARFVGARGAAGVTPAGPRVASAAIGGGGGHGGGAA